MGHEVVPWASPNNHASLCHFIPHEKTTNYLYLTPWLKDPSLSKRYTIAKKYSIIVPKSKGILHIMAIKAEYIQRIISSIVTTAAAANFVVY